MFDEQFPTSSPPPGTLQDANSTRAWGCRSVGRARRMAGLGSGVSSLELVEAELQAQGQWWISCGSHVLLHGLSVPRGWGQGALGSVPTGYPRGVFCSWGMSPGSSAHGGAANPCWGPPCWAGMRRRKEDMCHPHGDSWYQPAPCPCWWLWWPRCSWGPWLRSGCLWLPPVSRGYCSCVPREVSPALGRAGDT